MERANSRRDFLRLINLNCHRYRYLDAALDAGRLNDAGKDELSHLKQQILEDYKFINCKNIPSVLKWPSTCIEVAKYVYECQCMCEHGLWALLNCNCPHEWQL